MYHKNRIVGVGILCGFFCVLTALAKTETTVQTLPTEKPVTASAVSLKEIPLETRTFYQKTLTRLLEQHVLSDSDSTEADITDCRFAILDVNADGREELLLQWNDTDSLSVTAYDESHHQLQVLGNFDSDCRFYENLTVESNISHNAPYGSDRKYDFWPYEVSTYDADTQTYRSTATVWDWDKSISLEGPDPFGTFPDSIDRDNDGIVYLISDNMSQNTSAVDRAAFTSWVSSCRQTTQELTPDFQALTKETIAAIAKLPQTTSETSDTAAAAMSAFSSVLAESLQTKQLDIVTDTLFADGYPLDDASTLSEYRFAVADVDHDHLPELIITTDSDPSCARTLVIRYNTAVHATKKLCEKAVFDGSCTFYDNQTVEVAYNYDTALNSQKSSFFFPYTVYHYDETQSDYTQTGYVECWDKSVYNGSAYGCNAFPDDIDKDGDGIVYIIGKDDGSSSESSESSCTIVDRDGYEKWVKSYRKGARILPLSFLSLTKKHVTQMQETSGFHEN